MMTPELLKALQLIKEECSKYARCEGCMLYTPSRGCVVQDDTPDRWKLWKLENREEDVILK